MDNARIKTMPIFISFMIICLFLIALPVAAYPPGWINFHQDGSLKLSGVYHGVSFADFEGDTPGFDILRWQKTELWTNFAINYRFPSNPSLKRLFPNKVTLMNSTYPHPSS